MMPNFIDVAFDPQSFAAIEKLADFSEAMALEIPVALNTIGEMLVKDAQANTWTAFQNPTGALADTIQYYFQDAMTIVVGSDSPYAARLEFGFIGPDVLGRVFPLNPEPYLEPALVADTDQIVALMGITIGNLWAQVLPGGS
jgi:hypothetical protein